MIIYDSTKTSKFFNVFLTLQYLSVTNLNDFNKGIGIKSKCYILFKRSHESMPGKFAPLREPLPFPLEI